MLSVFPEILDEKLATQTTSHGFECFINTHGRHIKAPYIKKMVLNAHVAITAALMQ